jgi:N-acetylgalactosamine-6-sulfatase
MTGRYQQRVGGLECAIGLGNVGRYDDAIRLAEQHDLGLPAERSVLARGLQDAGYATAICGKWHLGYENKFLPRRHGFDYFFGPLGGGVDYFHHNEPGGEHMLFRNEERVRREGYLTDLIGAEAIAFLKRTKDRPFFLYVPFTAPHTPLQGPGDQRGEPTALADFNTGTRSTYIQMVERLDDQIGAILQTLDDAGAAENTLVLFASDNGGTRIGRNAPFSGTKGGTYEGGIRVPCIVRWPGNLPEASESSQAAITMDLTRSILAAANAKTPADKPLDGIDIVQHLCNRRPDEPRTLCWRQRRGETTWRGVRDGDLKLVSRQQGADRDDKLFELASDPAEQTDLRASRAADFERLQLLLARWEEEVKPSR